MNDLSRFLENLSWQFKPIILDENHEICIKFKKDATICSFGSSAPFYGEDGLGAERYLQVLSRRMTELPGSCMHVWRGNQIIGQIMLGRWKQDLSVGYVDHFYLIPEYRGKGFGRLLENYAMAFFKQLGISVVRLSVNPSNSQAVKFYLKQGWHDVGIRDDYPKLNYFEKKVNSV